MKHRSDIVETLLGLEVLRRLEVIDESHFLYRLAWGITERLGLEDSVRGIVQFALSLLGFEEGA